MRKRLILLGSGFLFTSAVFLFFTYAVGRDWTDSVDFDLTVRLQDEWLARKVSLWLLVSRLGDWGWSLGILFISLLIRKRWGLIGSSLIACVICLAVMVVLRSVIPHPAPPFMFYKGVYVWEFDKYYVHAESTYPSGHAFRSMFAAVVLAGLGSYWRLGLGVPILVGSAQILLGFHWSTDVAGGWILGWVGGLGSWFLHDSLKAAWSKWMTRRSEG